MIDTISWDICGDYADFSGEPVDEVRKKAAMGAHLAAQAWNSLPEKEFWRKAKRFYAEADSIYIYDHLLAHLNHGFIREWYQHHLEPRIKGKRVLDFGAGIAIFAIQMAMDGADVIYYDLPGVHKDFALWRVGHVEKYVGVSKGSLRFADGPYEQMYDVIFSYATLEHIHNAQLFRELEVMDVCLSKGGLMIHFIDPHADESHPMHRPKAIEAVCSWLDKAAYETLAEPVAPEPGVWRKRL